MGIGHVAVALGASRAVPRLNVGLLVFAALLADFLLGIFASLGLERAVVPDNYANKHYLLFDFPYSHGFLALLIWSAIFGFLVSRAFEIDAKRTWLVVGAVGLSHYLLDGLVHIAGLPLVGENSPKLGLGLWKAMPIELGLETLMALAGIVIYWKVSGQGGSAFGRYGFAVFVLLFMAMTWVPLALTTPPEPKQLTFSWIVAPLVLSAIAYVLDSRRARNAKFGQFRVSNP